MPAELISTVGAAGRPAAGRPASAVPALARATGLDAATFAERHWGRAPLLARAVDPHAFADLLDLDAVDELLSRRALRTPFIRLARDGTVVDSRSFTGSGGVGAEIADQVRDDRVAAMFGEGTTVVLQALHRTWPAVADFARELGGELGHPVQANAYVTPASSKGFSAHYDVHDVFVLQVAGRKHWTVHAPVHADPLRSQPWNDHAAAVAARAADDEPALDVVLEPGDALYLPRGWLHSATALGGVSAHLTVGVHVVTRYALVEALTALVADDPRLRASLPLGVDVADPAALGPHLEAVREALVDALAALPADAVAARVRERVWSGGRPEPVGPLAAAAFADGLSPGDVVRPRAGLSMRVVERGGSAVLELPDRTLALPASTLVALRAVTGPGRHTVGSLPGMDQADQLVLVRRLLREGVLVAATGP
ncbi:cupin domain-containing protein [Pseudonocardia humida]|uniref:cupin domain-containing protein n=1 Tax=Pseudonocardia humida TaxID=2800819 RepID=UPI00207D4F80|nr:cupin domain-containing protein [Pseudonocardia humida]